MNQIDFLKSRRWQDIETSLTLRSKGRCAIKLRSAPELGRYT